MMQNLYLKGGNKLFIKCRDELFDALENKEKEYIQNYHIVLVLLFQTVLRNLKLYKRQIYS